MIGSRLLAIALDGLLDLMERQGVSGKANSSRKILGVCATSVVVALSLVTATKSDTKFDVLQSVVVSRLMIWAEGRKCMKQQESSFHFTISENPQKFEVSMDSAEIFAKSRHLPLGSPLYAGTAHESQVFFPIPIDRSVDVFLLPGFISWPRFVWAVAAASWERRRLDLTALDDLLPVSPSYA